ncbi:hypothetical protein GF391_03580 [Candidatus Uhrbacteria bacterium]|nr:hypothetical protein [Candidatus Uhrbacteria bacterium]
MFRAVNNRCAVDFAELKLPIPATQAIEILENRGFQLFNPDIITAARSLIGKSIYKLGAKQFQAPNLFDCSSFTKWIYGQCGIWLPRRTIQQIEYGQTIEPQNIKKGDLVFTTGKNHNWFRTNPNQNVGHVGIATDNNSVIHAANSRAGVIESSLECFLKTEKYRSIQRIITQPAVTLFFHTPPEREVETSDDFFWIIVQTLK